MPPQVAIATETETERGWWFDARITPDTGDARTIRVRLDWSDYEHWTRGKTAPSVAAEALLRAAMTLGDPDFLPDSFDAAALRRRLPGLDERVRALLATDLRALGDT